MKKSPLYIFLTLCLTVSLTFGQSNDEDEKKQFKKTHVSSETLMGYGVDQNNKAKEVGVKKTTRLFDTNGNLTTLIEYNGKSQPIKRKVFKYNKKGVLIGGIIYEGYDKLVDKYKFSYNSNGDITHKKGFLATNIYDIEYTYNKQGQLTQKTKVKNGNENTYRFNYTYTNNLVTEEKYWSPKISVTKKMKYDSVGHLIQEKSGTKDYEGYTFEFVYDSLGNKTTETEYNLDGLPYEWFEYTYNDDKTIKTIQKYNFRGDLSLQWNYYYDGKGNLETVKIYESKKAELIYITNYLYKYHKK